VGLRPHRHDLAFDQLEILFLRDDAGVLHAQNFGHREGAAVETLRSPCDVSSHGLRSVRGSLQGAADLLDAVALDDVADPHVLIVLKRHAALLAGLDLGDFVLEALEG
jgi:hypothetical protein